MMLVVTSITQDVVGRLSMELAHGNDLSLEWRGQKGRVDKGKRVFSEVLHNN